MRKLFYTLALVVIGFTASYAQKQKATPEQKAEKKAIALQKKLSLSDDQKTKIQALELEKIKKHQEWNNTDKSADKTEERKAFSKANKEKIDAVLTPEQKKTWEQAKKEKHQKKEGKHQKGHKDEKDDKTLSAPAKHK